MKKAAFIDRDGTLIEEVNFLSRVDELRLFDYTANAVAELRSAGFNIFVVTNQSGIGRDLYSLDDMNSIHAAMQERLGGASDGFYFCPHLPDAGCRCRKPNLGMIESACADFEIDLKNSWMIGDKKLDVETGFNAGISTAMVMTGYGNGDFPMLERSPDVVGDTLLDAVRKIVGNRKAF
jgi:D-glycero-D-manno-heptose 1,7-bisphosphate phosphatase